MNFPGIILELYCCDNFFKYQGLLYIINATLMRATERLFAVQAEKFRNTDAISFSIQKN